jgi:uncharacterized RDD family membrane protein YckC
MLEGSNTPSGSDENIPSTARVCPECGELAGSQPFCAACGLNLSQQQRLPSRGEWEVAHPLVPVADAAFPTPAELSCRGQPTAADPAPEASEELAPERPEWTTPLPPMPSHEPVFTPTTSEPSFSGTPMANWGYRVGAFLVDVSLVVLVGLGVGYLAEAAGADSDTAESIGGLTILGAWLINTSVVVGLTRGQSLGKRLAGTRIVRENGLPARFGIGLVRDTICRLLYIIPLVALVDAFMPLGENRQSLRDKIVRTRVLREPAYRARRWILTLAAVLLTGSWVAVSIAAGSWDSTTNYSALDRDVFISGCADEGGSEAGCSCAFDYVKARVPYDEYAQADRTEVTSDWPPRVRRTLADAFTNCDAF